ncbi:hypothetical protein JTB14_001911 [Gonioctena quinquepunctata]|nr:hypothetical protein JTB14_001911 [Gonioctena quinquepunctata]
MEAMNEECRFCGALKWQEKAAGMCCSGGKVALPLKDEPVEPLRELFQMKQMSLAKGQEGYSFDIPQTNPVTKQPIPNEKVSCKDFHAYHMMFLVDMYVKVESERSRFIALNQRKLRTENYIHPQDAIRDDADLDPNNLDQMGEIKLGNETTQLILYHSVNLCRPLQAFSTENSLDIDRLPVIHWFYEVIGLVTAVVNDKGRPVSWAMLAPSITPRRTNEGPNNPGLRLYKFDKDTGQVFDYTQFYLDLSTANANDNKNAEWAVEYNFSTYYSVNEISAVSLHSLADKFTQDNPQGHATFSRWVHTE